MSFSYSPIFSVPPIPGASLNNGDLYKDIASMSARLNELERLLNPYASTIIKAKSDSGPKKFDVLAREAGPYDDDIVEFKHPWQGYSVPYEGKGKPPSDQWKKFRVLPGVVNNVLPDNPNEIFTAFNGATFSLNIDIETSDVGYTRVMSCNVFIGDPGDNITTDQNGMPIRATARLGTAYVYEDDRTVKFIAHRNSSFSYYCVRTTETCNRYYYSSVLI